MITSRYQDALALYSQTALLGRFGGECSRNTLAGKVVQVGAAVQPIINLLRDSLLDAEAALPKAARTSTQPAAQYTAAIGELYAIETNARDGRFEERTPPRKRHSWPALARVEALLLAQLHSVLLGSLLGQALHYLSEQRPNRTCFVEDGRCPIENNAWENLFRLFVVVRRDGERQSLLAHRNRQSQRHRTVPISVALLTALR